MSDTPASLITTGARRTRPSSAIRTPAARPFSTTISATSARDRTFPPAASITGTIVSAIRRLRRSDSSPPRNSDWPPWHGSQNCPCSAAARNRRTGREDGPQLLVLSQPLEHLAQRLVGISQEGPPQKRADKHREERRQRFFREIARHARLHAVHEFKVPLDDGRLIGKAADKSRLEMFLALGKVESLVADNHAVVNRPHVGPFELASETSSNTDRSSPPGCKSPR